MLVLLASFSLLFSAVGLVVATDVCAFNTNACFSQALCCSNLPNNVCCSGWPVNFGASVEFINPPPNVAWIGEGFADPSCINLETSGGTPGNTCIFVCNTCSATKSAGWRFLPQFVGESSNATGQASGCVKPDVARFVDSTGEHHEIRIPEDDPEKVIELLSAGDFEALLQL